ncbi:MBL fold metallo-hydrolase [Pseudorhodoferax sp. Leaf267]|uniref:MBL fold metallo-hydrolase n=1 Tax=Pseudorhodoferax sp. Leaf267 TaxID=1736316 RepID=UPI0006FABF23|nr:MBL fold metallo-hydrolase [Pseudorhodoferax sp. Leaf267]KQP14103.1 MBL fold metallo-hydrolase [Pseudorhodoferax sp. Leaf267]
MTTGAPRNAAGRFLNTEPFAVRSLGEVLRWQRHAWRNGLPPPPQQRTPTRDADLDFIARNAGGALTPAVTWLGHATVLAQFGGVNLLTDPHCSHRASPFSFSGPRRAQPPAIALDRMPPIDLVLVSHNHYDHLDDATVRALAAQAGGGPLFVVPLGLKQWFARRGITRVEELDWWQPLAVQGVQITLTPVRHWSARALGDRMASLWGGFAVLGPDLHLYFGGDTGYSPSNFVDTRTHFAARQTVENGGGFDIALLPIGAYAPRWFMAPQHVNPEEAVRIHLDLGAKRSLGVHWGTFELTDEPLDEPPRALAEAARAQGLMATDFGVIAIGETLRLPARQAPPSHDNAQATA